MVSEPFCNLPNYFIDNIFMLTKMKSEKTFSKGILYSGHAEVKSSWVQAMQVTWKL